MNPLLGFTQKALYETSINMTVNKLSLAASFRGIFLLSAFILLRRLKLASVSIFHS